MSFDEIDGETRIRLQKIFENAHLLNDNAVNPEKARREQYQQLITPWSIRLLLNPSFRFSVQPNRRPPPPLYSIINCSMFSQTLWTDETMSAMCTFYLASSEGAAIKSFPETFHVLCRIGTGVDAMAGRASGALSGVLFDMSFGLFGMDIHQATTTLNLDVQFLNPIVTPCVLLVKCWATKIQGRRCWLEGVIENGESIIFAKGTALMVNPKKAVGGKFGPLPLQ